MPVIDYPDGSDDSAPILLTDNNTVLRVISGTATQSGVISESGGSHFLTTTGAGTLIVSANNTYSGGTLIAAGTVQIGNGGATGSLGTGAITVDGNLIFDLSSNITANVYIGGGGILTQMGSGTLTLTAGGTTGGQTIIATGKLALSGNGGASGILTDNGIFDISGISGSVSAVMGLAGSGSVILGDKTLLLEGSGAFAGAIHGSGGVSIFSGTSIWSGVEDFTGATNINNGGTTLALTGAGDISRSSGIAFNSSGVFDISGIAAASTTIQSVTGQGTINLGNRNLTITAATGAFNGNINGSGSVILSGGLLTANGTIGSNSLTVDSGATLGGTGSVTAANILNGGILNSGGPSAGFSAGTLHIEGNLTLQPGAIDTVELLATGTDETIVNGAANIAGATLVETINNGTNAIGTSFTILKASGGVNGAFANVLAPGAPAGTHPSLIYDANDVYLRFLKTPGDFNADGLSDILWQNDSGQAAIWQMNGTTVSSAALPGPNPGTDWKVRGAADFNGDGNADILWQDTSGQAAVWVMNGTTGLSYTLVGNNPGPGWKVVAGGDFEGDGKSGILWQNDNGQAAIWLLSRSPQTINVTFDVNGSFVGPNPGTSWHIEGAGDFNADGKADILWQNDSGQVAIWLMNGTSATGGNTVGANPGTSWHIKGSGDFNGDGYADILWQNDSGQAAIWLMHGTSVIDAAAVSPNPGSGWKITGTGDFNGDGRADILWQNANGQAAVWTMSGTTVLSASVVGNNPGAAWHITAGTGS